MASCGMETPVGVVRSVPGGVSRESVDAPPVNFTVELNGVNQYFDF
jgi:hypothetical protein